MPNGCNDQYERVCSEAFERLCGKIDALGQSVDRLDIAIRGGHEGGGRNPGIYVRLDRLEQWVARASKLIWTLVTAVVGLMGNLVWQWVTKK